MIVEITAKPLRYNGTYHAVGTKIDMKPAHANLFIALRKVVLPTPDIPDAGEIPHGPVDRAFDHPPLDEQRVKRPYKRRDLQAE